MLRPSFRMRCMSSRCCTSVASITCSLWTTSMLPSSWRRPLSLGMRRVHTASVNATSMGRWDVPRIQHYQYTTTYVTLIFIPVDAYMRRAHHYPRICARSNACDSELWNVEHCGTAEPSRCVFCAYSVVSRRFPRRTSTIRHRSVFMVTKSGGRGARQGHVRGGLLPRSRHRHRAEHAGVCTDFPCLICWCYLLYLIFGRLGPCNGTSAPQILATDVRLNG